jgi:hypothetical protein
MAKNVFFMGMLVLALTFGLVVMGCDNGTTDDDNNVTYKYVYVTVSGNGGSSYSSIPNNTDNGKGPYTDANSYLQGVDGLARTKQEWFSGIKSYYQTSSWSTVAFREDGESLIVSNFTNTDYRVKYTLKN